MKFSTQKWLKAITPLLVLGGCVMLAQVIIASKPRPGKKPRAERAVLVEAIKVTRGPKQALVEGHGSVYPLLEVTMSAEISGRVIWKHPGLTAGGQVKKGELLVKIDPRDYRLSLAQQQAAVERARAELQIEQGRRKVAEREWKLFGEGGVQSELALRDPQMRTARLGVNTAMSSAGQAKLKLNRTKIYAPIDAMVRSSNAAVGKLVAPGEVVGTLVHTDIYLVAVLMKVSDLEWLKIPGTNAPPLNDEVLAAARAASDPLEAFAKLGSLAMITQDLGDGKQIIRSGMAVRLLVELDTLGRMAALLVSVRDPLGLDEDSRLGGSKLPLLLGSYVKVELAGNVIEDAVEVPRRALRDGNRVYVYTADKRLEIRDVDVARRRAETVIVTSGLEGGELIITTALPAAVEGMDLRLADDTAREGAPRAATEKR